MTLAMTEHTAPRPVVLCILDGWGDGPDTETNAITRAHTPNWDAMRAESPFARLDASEHYVGLPDGQMGNSEVGHMNLGAGRVVLQDLPRIDAAIADGSLQGHSDLLAFIAAMRESGGTAHIAGLMSPGGVHSHQDQIAALARILADSEVPVRIHAFLDGRDTPPSSALGYLETFVEKSGGVPLATICGRYFAMDRDKRWNRVERAYRLIAEAEGQRSEDAFEAIRHSYDAGVTDEFLEPTVIGDFAGMQDGDGLLMANFRADRAREILTALLDPTFDGFERPRQISFAATLGLIEYSEALNPLIDPLFPSLELRNVFGQVLADAHLKQLRIAETEKYAHVTFFFNGGQEHAFNGEERILIASPDVATYDLQPEMSAREVTDRLVAAIATGAFDFILVNYANTDMVGHTGIFPAAVRAVEAVDDCLGRLRNAVLKAGGVMLVTADHGNAEMMVEPSTAAPHTAHTMNLVPALLVGEALEIEGLRDGCLADVAPTLLDLMRLPQPAEMTGESLLTAADKQRVAI